MEYAAGSLSEEERLLACAHFDLRPSAAAQVRLWESVGAVLMAATPPAAMTRLGVDAIFREDTHRDARGAGRSDNLAVSRKLRSRDFAMRDFEAIVWRSHFWGLSEHSRSTGSLRMLKLEAGVEANWQARAHAPLALILQGGLEDSRGRFKVGDIAFAEDGVEGPVRFSGDQHCICLTLSDPLRH